MDGRADRWVRERRTDAEDRRALQQAAVEAAGQWIAGLRPWDLFVTLTYDRRRWFQETVLGADVVRAVSPWKAKRDGRKYLRELPTALGRPVSGVLGVEAHKDGSAHLHGVLGINGLQGDEFKRGGRLWFQPHGFAKLEIPESGDDVAGYCAKYLAKDHGELLFSKDLVGQYALGTMRTWRGVL